MIILMIMIIMLIMISIIMVISIITVISYDNNEHPNNNSTPNLPTNTVDFKGFDSSIILNSRGGIPRPIRDSPESFSRAMLVGTMLVERLDALPKS